jgi:N-acetylglucosamine-6-phosphate deacetylase
LTAVAGASAAPAEITFSRNILSIQPRRSSVADHLLPGFIDLQVNGAYGIDVMAASARDLVQLSHCLAHEGTTAWLPTVITAPLETIERCDSIIAEAMAAQHEIAEAAQRGNRQPCGATILGMHLEGPFISPIRRGAHPPLNLLPRSDPLERVLALKSLRLITLAPELDGALAAIPRLIARNVAVSIGHTDASYEQAVAGLKAGATMFTHLFNAMRPFHHRSPGAVGAAADCKHANADPYVGVIPDGAHLHPATLRLIDGLKLIFTTDRVSVAGTEGAVASISGLAHPEIHFRDGAARLADGTLAGSTITMLDGARRMINELGGDWSRIAAVCAFHPARLLGLGDRGAVESRLRADLILLDQQLNLKAVYIGGREID